MRNREVKIGTAAVQLFWALLALSMHAGCTPPKVLEWQCPVPVRLVIDDTTAVLECPADGRRVVVTYPAGALR